MRLQWAYLLTALILAAAVRSWGISDPFVHSYDSAFQESLALAHLTHGLSVTRGLAVTAVMDGKPFFHASHPPLLQLIYAGLYSLLGVNEWVSRLVSIIAALGAMICLWFVLIKARARHAAIAAVFVFALLPLSVRFGRTTNYEPLSVFLICLLLAGYEWRDRWWGVALMCLVAVAGGLFEWTVYLAFPALALALLISTGRAGSVKPVIFPSLLAAGTLAALFAYQNNIVGHIPVLARAGVRSNPMAIAGAPGLQAMISRLYDFGPALPLSIWGMALLFIKCRSRPDLARAAYYFMFLPLLFFLSAMQLVFSHPIALYYLVPGIALLTGLIAEGQGRDWIWIVLVLSFGVFIYRDREVVTERNPFYYNLMKMVMQEEQKREFYAFDSDAVGYLRGYLGIETIYPLGGNEPPVGEIVSNDKVRYFMTDTLHPEVDYVRQTVSTAPGLYLKWRFSQVEVWKRGSPDGAVHLTNELNAAELPPQTSNFWETPSAAMMKAEDRVRFGILHQTRSEGASTIVFKGVNSGKWFEATAYIDPEVCRPDLTDGVEYAVTMRSGRWERSAGDVLKPTDEGCPSKAVSIDLYDAPRKVDVELTVMPLGSPAYDRFFWEDPRITP